MTESFKNEKAEKLPDLSSFQQERVKKIENLELGPFPAAESILIFLGYKPATEIDLAPWNDSPEKVMATLRESGLIAEIKKYKGVNDKRFSVVAVTRNKETMEKLKKVEANADHQEYGRLMGYPNTAIDAYLNKEKLLSEKDYPNLSGNIMDFKLSKDHWQEEIKVIQQWSQVIKQYSPKLYDLLIPKP